MELKILKGLPSASVFNRKGRKVQRRVRRVA
jgi:hypothetical protein